jgi:hypothetical protein
LIKDEDWTEPTSLEEAEKMRIHLVGEIEDMEAQLGDRVRRQSSDYTLYYRWRQSVKWARTVRLQKLRLTKQWISEHSHDYKESETLHNGR